MLVVVVVVKKVSFLLFWYGTVLVFVVFARFGCTHAFLSFLSLHYATCMYAMLYFLYFYFIPHLWPVFVFDLDVLFRLFFSIPLFCIVCYLFPSSLLPLCAHTHTYVYT